mgnify:CR=1 FL=1
MDGIYYAVAIWMITGGLGLLIGRLSVKTKVQTKVDDHECRLSKIETAIPLMLKCHVVQLVALKEKLNGDCAPLLDEVNEYLYHK